MTKICVIGAGFAGLALAIRLQAAGITTCVIEAHSKLGGRCAGHERDGFTFNSGPSTIGTPAAFHQLWELAGANMADDVALLPVEPIRRHHWIDGQSLDINQDEQALRRDFARIAPDDAKGFDDFIHWVDRARGEAGLEAHSDRAETIPALIKSLPYLIRHQGLRSAYGLVSHYVNNPKLREVLTAQMLLSGVNPLTACAFHAAQIALDYSSGAWWPKGGMNRLAQAMAALLQRQGSSITLHDPVLHIHTIGDRVSEVECISGKRERFDAVISTADPVHTYRDLLAGTKRGDTITRKLVRQEFAPSNFTVHFALEGTWPGIPHETVLFGPRYRGLLEDVFRHGVLPRDQIIFLSHPSVTDPTLAPVGKSCFQATIPVANQNKLPIDWDHAGPLIEKRILDEVGRRFIPDFHDRLICKFHISPRDLALDYNSWGGSVFGLEDHSALNIAKPPILPVKDPGLANFYFAGGSRFISGINGALSAARVTAERVLHDLQEEKR